MNVQLRSTTEMSSLISKEMPNIYLHHSYPEKELQSFFYFFICLRVSFWQALHHVDIGKFQISC